MTVLPPHAVGRVPCSVLDLDHTAGAGRLSDVPAGERDGVAYMRLHGILLRIGLPARITHRSGTAAKRFSRAASLR